ncbi:MAG: glycosyltransferase [Gemmatimonadota bacterium]
MTRAGTAAPRISIVVPTYDRPTQLAACLAALAAQDLPRHSYEVIVVNDAGRLPLDPVIAAWRDRMTLSLVSQQHQGPAAARNTGAAHAAGALLAFTDDDCAPDPGWAGALAERLEVSPDRMFGGRTVLALPDNPYSAASQTLIDHLYAWYNQPPDTAQFLTSNNMAVAAARFRSLGGFHVSRLKATAEDREFCDRWLRTGGGITYAPEAVVRHAHPLTLRRFWRQHMNYGRGAYYLHRVRQASGDRGVRVEPPPFYGDLLRAPWRAPGASCRKRQVALLALSQVANVAGFVWEAVRHGRAYRGPRPDGLPVAGA